MSSREFCRSSCESVVSVKFQPSDRELAVADARHSSEFEGARSTDATRADQDAYVRGEIDVEPPLGDSGIAERPLGGTPAA